jgi:hypothetical protein
MNTPLLARFFRADEAYFSDRSINLSGVAYAKFFKAKELDMLKIALDGNELRKHRDEIEAYFNIYVGPLAEEFSSLRFKLKEVRENTRETLFHAELRTEPYVGKPMAVETRSSQATSAIEICFARARRTILREQRIAALS